MPQPSPQQPPRPPPQILDGQLAAARNALINETLPRLFTLAQDLNLPSLFIACSELQAVQQQIQARMAGVL